MSNESGPFVVFFLPAVVGCLTILLARRWAYSQVSTTSTAVSRRRKIIKDPLIKRPLPTIPCKMVAPTSKKSSGTAKKGVSTVLDDDVTGNKKAKPRLSLTPLHPVAGVKFVDNPLPPKHIPFPYIPQDGEILFEFMTFVFMLVATGLQFLNLYRTMWWLPHSYTNQAMVTMVLLFTVFMYCIHNRTFHFYLIDSHLVAFVVTILSRRLLLSLTIALLRSVLAPKLLPHAIIAARMFILGVVLGALSWCAYFIALKHPPLKIFYLCYPAVIYFILFGFQASSFLELNHTDTPPMHCCSHEPEQVRSEVEVLRQDFNMRVKKILFNSMVGAYYTSFVPCCFVQSFVYYDVRRCATQVGLVWGALCGRYAAQLLPAALCDVHHRAARHLGCWRRGAGTGEAAEWSGARWWGAGAQVARAGGVYEAAAHTVAADPADAAHARFYKVFSDPSRLLCAALSLQLALLLLQLCLLLAPCAWHHLLAVLLLLPANYYTLFKTLRDYLVAWKVYRAENIIQDKNAHCQT